MDPVIGVLYIGQAPRPELVAELQTVMGDKFQVIEAGALDGLTLDEVMLLAPEPGDEVLVTKMTDGTVIRVAEKHVTAMMQGRIDYLLAKGAQVITIICTGVFPPFKCEKVLVEPDEVLYHFVSIVGKKTRLGIMLPDARQLSHGESRWSHISLDVKAVKADPFGDKSEIKNAAVNLVEWGADMVIMDCMGYTLDMKKTVANITHGPVILARSTVAKVMSELI